MLKRPATTDTSPAPTPRISVVRDQHLVPLLTSAHAAPTVQQPWQGVLLEQHQVRPGEIPEHEHPDLCLHLQLSGTRAFEWWSEGKNNVEQTRPGSLILIPAGTRDRLHWTGASERLIVSVRQDRLAHLAGTLDLHNTPEFAPNWAFTDPAIGNLIHEMGQQAQGSWPLGSLYADLLALGLETQLLRTRAATPFTTQPIKGGLALPKLRRAMEYINANLATDLRLEAIAQELNLSTSHFAHEFRNSTGQTPYQYLLDQRITTAKRLLKMTNAPVQLISAQVGFSSAVNFVRSFRERVGVTPAAWRKNT